MAERTDPRVREQLDAIEAHLDLYPEARRG